MKYINKIRNFYIPFDYPKFALVISIAALAFAASSHNTPCISAQSTCSVGSDNEFTGNISLKGGTAYKSTFDASGITADRTLTIPNNTGTLALTSDIPSSSYTPDAPFLKADGTGAATSGTATADAPFVSVDASGQLDSSATLTADAPFLSANASGQIAAGGSLTASTPLKSSATGQIAASDLDITTDITPGTALQEIRVNSGGTALEYFTPSSGGGRWSLVGQGTAVNDNSYGTGTAIVCWYDNTQGTGIGGSVDQTKTYKLVLKPTNDPWYSPSLPSSVYPEANWKVDNSCVSGAVSAFGGSNSAGGQGYAGGGWHSNNAGYQYYSQKFHYQQGTVNNGGTGGSQCGFSSFEIIFHNGVPITSSNTNNEGIKFNYESHAQCYQGSVAHASQWQTGGGLAIMNSGDTSGENFDDVTGMYFVHYGDGTQLPD